MISSKAAMLRPAGRRYPASPWHTLACFGDCGFRRSSQAEKAGRVLRLAPRCFVQQFFLVRQVHFLVDEGSGEQPSELIAPFAIRFIFKRLVSPFG